MMISESNKLVEQTLANLFKNYKIELNFHELSSTGKTFVYKDNTSLCKKDRAEKTKHLLNYLKKEKKINKIVEVYNGVLFSIDCVGPRVKILFKPSTAKQLDPHELMTASCILYGGIDLSKTSLRPDKILKLLKTQAKKVKGYNPEELKYFDCSYDVLAQAISSANAILKHNPKIKNDPKRKITMDPSKWKFPHNTRAYNSSDLIIKYDGDKYLGISLKKRISKQTTPTLINKSCDDFIENIVDDSISKRLKESKIKFCELILDTLGVNYTDDTLMDQYRKQCQLAKGRQTIKDLLVSDQNSYFIMIDKILRSQKHRFVQEILKLAFRYELKTLKCQNFNFSLVIGTGDYKNFTFTVREGRYENINKSIRKINAILKKDNFDLRQTPKRQQAFQKNAKSEKLYYTIYSEGKAIMNVELRYKGMYNRNPSFFAYLLE